jgi:hypothetical protein
MQQQQQQVGGGQEQAAGSPEQASNRAPKPAKKKWLACFVPRAFSG